MNSPPKTSYSAAIFDMDGLLLDTEKIYTEVTSEIVKGFGKSFSWELKARMMGRKALDAANILVNELSLPIKAEEYLDLQKEAFKEKFPACNLMPGIQSFCQKLFQLGIPTAVATSSSLFWFDYKTRNHQTLFNHFDIVITGDHPEVKNGKPNPDIFLVTSNKLGIEPDQCVVFEDSLLGIEAASSASMLAVAIPDPRAELNLFANADLILSEISQFDISLFKQSSI